MDKNNVFAVAKSDLFDVVQKLKRGDRLTEGEAIDGEALFDDFLDFCVEYGIIEPCKRKTRDFFGKMVG